VPLWTWERERERERVENLRRRSDNCLKGRKKQLKLRKEEEEKEYYQTSPNLLRFEKYGSCDFFQRVCCVCVCVRERERERERVENLRRRSDNCLEGRKKGLKLRKGEEEKEYYQTSPNLLRFERYCSCDFFPFVLETPKPKIKKKALRKLI